MKNRGELRKKLHARNPRCYWCNRETVIPEKRSGGPQASNNGTLDHLYSRFDLRRWVQKEKGVVLACYECNQNRARAEELALPKEELFRRSKGYTLNPKINGVPLFTKTLPTLKDVIDRLETNGIIIPMIKMTGKKMEAIVDRVDVEQQLNPFVDKKIILCVDLRGSVSLSYTGILRKGSQFYFEGHPSITFLPNDVTHIETDPPEPIIRISGG